MGADEQYRRHTLFTITSTISTIKGGRNQRKLAALGNMTILLETNAYSVYVSKPRSQLQANRSRYLTFTLHYLGTSSTDGRERFRSYHPSLMPEFPHWPPCEVRSFRTTTE